MKAAVVRDFGAPPVIEDHPEPAAGEGELLIRVLAAPISPIVRALASGRHYSGTGEAGFVAGVDGVGTDPDGRLRYFLFPKSPLGSMAELSVASTSMTVEVPSDLSATRAAAVASAGLASWIALTRRAPIEPGATVMIAGVTGAAGSMAVQIARHLGAKRVVGIGRSAERLSGIALDAAIPLDEDADAGMRAEFDRSVDVVLDFIWGDPATRLIAAATSGRGARTGEPRLRYVQLGTIAGDTIPIRGDALRSSGLELLGSGIGSVPVQELARGAGELLTVADKAGFDATYVTHPLSQVAEAWSAPADVRRLLIPGA